MLLVLAASFPVIFAFGADRRHRDGIVGSMGVTLLGIVWIGIPLVHAVLLRDLPDHGAALIVDVLVGTFAADTGAYAVGRMFGCHKIAPSLSPNKTLEGLIGGFVIGTMGFWFAGLYQDWLSGVDALIIGAAVAAVAPVGDLFESMLKRDLGKRTPARSSAPTAASSTASTPSSSRSSSATTWPCSSSTEKGGAFPSPRRPFEADTQAPHLRKRNVVDRRLSRDRRRDRLCRRHDTVGSKQLKSNAVTTKKIKKEAITAKKVRKGP